LNPNLSTNGEEHREFYELPSVVRTYCSNNDLQRPEEKIISILKDQLYNMRMLDIGIGTGRTTIHFANLVKEYVGIDYSKNMISACKNRFSNLPQNVSFKVCDAKSMNIFEDNYFDFILFSYNGIDCVSHEYRFQILNEIRRICTKGGYFSFSSHNIQSLTIRGFKNLSDLKRRIKRYQKLLRANKQIWRIKKKKYALVKDSGHDFRIGNYYIKPEEQLKQLTDMGFTNIRTFSFNSGKEIVNNIELNKLTDSWLYYLANI